MVKRKRTSASARGTKTSSSKAGSSKAARSEAFADADVHSDQEASTGDEGAAAASDEDGDAFFETPDEKRVRLAKEYLSKLGETKLPNQVGDQLAQDVAEEQRRSRIQIADVELGEPSFRKGHRFPATCVCLSSDERTAYTGGKDCAILRWDIETGKKDVLNNGGRNKFDCGGHFQHVRGVCLVESKQLLVSVGVDQVVRLWDWRAPSKSSCTAKLLGHQGTVNAVAVEPDGKQFYTASDDKSLKVWDLTARRETDTLLGHVTGVTSMDLYNQARPLTGGADKTVRLWKTDKDTHLMFSKHTYSVDAVSVMDHDRFLSGSQDGNLLLWSTASKKPLASASLGSNCWVTAVAAIRRGNVFFSGSIDGNLRTWRCTREGKEDSNLKIIPAAKPVDAPGVVNAVAVGRRLLACAIGKEHKLGRWMYEKKDKNGLLVVPLSYREE